MPTLCEFRYKLNIISRRAFLKWSASQQKLKNENVFQGKNILGLFQSSSAYAGSASTV